MTDCPDHSESEPPWMCACTARKLAALTAENAILRVAFGIQENERIPLDQTPHFGSISVDSGTARRRIEPINDDVIRLEREVRDLRHALEIATGERDALGVANKTLRLEREVYLAIRDALVKERDAAMAILDPGGETQSLVAAATETRARCDAAMQLARERGAAEAQSSLPSTATRNAIPSTTDTSP